MRALALVFFLTGCAQSSQYTLPLSDCVLVAVTDGRPLVMRIMCIKAEVEGEV